MNSLRIFQEKFTPEYCQNYIMKLRKIIKLLFKREEMVKSLDLTNLKDVHKNL